MGKVKYHGSTSKLDYNNIPIPWREVNRIISKFNRIMLTTHENPDGDGLGAESGIYYHLKEMGKDVRIINYSPLPDEYKYLNDNDIFECFDISKHQDWLENTDLAIIFDVGDYVRIRSVKDVIEKYNINTMNIDHHPHHGESIFTYNLIDLSAAATGCMVYDLIKASDNKKISKESILGIYTAVMTDTGCFKYSNTDKKCHEIAIDALSQGIKTHLIYQKVYENSSRSRMKLMGAFLSKLQYELNGEFAWSVINKNMLKEAQASKADVEGFSDMIRTISGVEVALMIFEQTDSKCRINFRSKGKYVVNDIAKELGGGGHPFAAGAMVDGNMKSVVKKVINVSMESLKNKLDLS